MHGNPSHINYGFHYGEAQPPALPPGYTQAYYPTVPQYSNSIPPPINTHYTATSGLPHTTAAPKGTVSRCRCLCIVAAVFFALLILAAVAVLIWYYLYGVCQLGRRCGQSKTCVSSSQWCDGRRDCPAGEDEAQCFRFYGPDFMLQSYSIEDQTWKMVCSDRWNDITGKKACQEIGYSGSDYVTYGTLNPGLSTVNSYMTLKSDYSNALSSEPVHSSLINNASCSTNTVVTLKCIDCGQSQAPGARIVGGEVVNSLGRWPWQVSLQIRGSHVCGGSIVTPLWIVTAAHCVQKYSSPSQWTVYAGYLTLSQMYSVSGNSVIKIIAHANFDTVTFNNDIALMKLAAPLLMQPSISPVCLPNIGLDISVSRVYYITGWGLTQNQGSVSNDLREAQVSLISRMACNSPQVYNGAITNTMICAGKLSGGVDTCQGDSGGPLVVSQNFVWWLVGDTSWGRGCAVQNSPGIYGNVTFFIDWIYMQMKAY